MLIECKGQDRKEAEIFQAPKLRNPHSGSSVNRFIQLSKPIAQGFYVVIAYYVIRHMRPTP